MSNRGLEQFINKIGLKFYRSNIGDKFVSELMRKKNCKGVDAINAEITTPTNSNNSNSLAAQLKELKEMYQAGDLTKEEYEKAKRKVLD